MRSLSPPFCHIVHRLPKACIPDEPLEYDIFGPGITENPGYMAAVREGKLQPMRGETHGWPSYA